MEKLFEVLEFDKIKNLLLKYNVNKLSLKKVLELKPSFKIETVKEELLKTKEAYLLVNMGTFPSLTYVSDISDYLTSLSKNATIELKEIYEFVSFLEAINALKNFVNKNKLNEDSYFYTLDYINNLKPINELLNLIKNCISPNYTLFDDASSKLKNIRNAIKKCENEIKDKLNSYLKNEALYLSDNYIATRGNHYVLPVKAAYKNKISGLVIDVSDSQNTIFIEPYSIIENNVTLENLHYEESLEVARIIKSICEYINKYNDILVINNKILGELSFMILKGSFGLNNNYEIATINENNKLELIKATHPLIPKDVVVSNDFYLGGENSKIIVISGPNAGGKTVALKTVGLLVLMNQCGLPISVSKATLPIFSDIFVDIGDEQSIALSLSGFSSHMKNVSYIINHLNKNSLVIMDELGSKTDPLEGEALAKAIIDYLEDSGAMALITTHYLGIKDYAKENSMITLASMSFDEDSLKPTYKLLLDVIGRSYALEISLRLGLKKEIIEKAKTYKNNRTNDLDALIDEMSLKLKKQENIIASLNEKEKELNNKLLEINKSKEKLEKEYQKALDEINTKKEEIIDDAIQEILDISDEYKNKLQQEGFKQHLKNKALENLEALKESSLKENKSNEKLEVGDSAIIKDLNSKVTIKEIKGDKAVVINNNTTMIVSLNSLIKTTNEPKTTKKNITHNYYDNLARNIPISLNIIGLHVDEALVAIKNYLDSASLVNYQSVTIIHGFGSGTLRKITHEYLKKCPYVKEFHLGGFNEGGSGATIVQLKHK